jgi:hypothetical protein
MLPPIFFGNACLLSIDYFSRSTQVWLALPQRYNVAFPVVQTFHPSANAGNLQESLSAKASLEFDRY